MKVAVTWALGLALSATPLLGHAQLGPAALVPPSPSAATPATSAPPVTPPAPAGTHALTAEDATAWLDGIMPYALARGGVAGGVVVIVKDGQILTQKGYGYADLAAHKPVGPDTLFRPGSVSKLFTWTAVMQMVEQGKIDLDHDVNAYLDFAIPPYAGRPVTMRNLMTHTGGFEEAFKDLIADDPAPGIGLADYTKNHLPARIFPPGEVPAYSNYGATLAGYIVQRVSGQPFDDYVEQHIFTPLGMQHASFRQPLPPALKPLLSRAYATASGEPKPFEIVIPAPAGSSSVSGAEMAKFMIAHLQDGEYQGQHILQPATAREMHETALQLVPPLNSMLLGFYQMNRNGHRIIGHGGDTRWFHSELTLFPDDHVGIFVSLNSLGEQGAAGPIRRALREGFTDRYFPGAASAGVTAGAQATADAARLAGTYVSSRRGETNAFSLLSYILGATTVTAKADGTITASDENDLASQPEPFGPAGPFVWRATNGQNRVAAKLAHGAVSMWGDDESGAVQVDQPPPWYKNAGWLRPALTVSVVVLLLTALLWPVVALFRRRYAGQFTLAGGPAWAYRLTRVASLLDGVVLVAWVVTLLTMLTTFSLNASLDPLLLGLHWAANIVFPLALLVFVWNAAVVFTTRTGVRSWFARGWSVLLVASGVVVLWTGVAFHLIGTSVQY